MDELLGAEAIRRALEEDHTSHDITTELLGEAADRIVTGSVFAEQECIVAGGPVAAGTFTALDASVICRHAIDDGSEAHVGDRVLEVTGSVRVLLAGERVALNFLQRLSAVATLTRRAVEAVAGTGATITDTRKTTPGLRDLEKYAVRMGGGENHRMSLADAVLFKDNHWAMLARSARSLADALADSPDGRPVTVEVETDEQLAQAIEACVPRILVDNKTPEEVAAWVRRCGRDVAVEASGGITVERAAHYARAGARYISIGALTHSAGAVAMRFDLF